MAWACMAASGTGSLVLLIGQSVTVQMDNDLMQTIKATQEFLKAKKWDTLQWPGQPPDLSPTEWLFSC